MTVSTLYLTSNGLHTHLIFPRNDVIAHAPYLNSYFQTADFIQIGWGDYNYYGNPLQSRWMGLKALLFPTSSVLGVQGVRDINELTEKINVYEISLEKLNWNYIVDFVCSFFKTDDLGQVSLVRIKSNNEHFFAAYGTYSLFNTCNNWTARALKTGGIDVNSKRSFSAHYVENQVISNGYKRLLR